MHRTSPAPCVRAPATRDVPCKEVPALVHSDDEDASDADPFPALPRAEDEIDALYVRVCSRVADV